jgi:hypothetical protein
MMLWSCWRPIPLSFSLPSAFSPTGCWRRHNCCQPNQRLLNNTTNPPTRTSLLHTSSYKNQRSFRVEEEGGTAASTQEDFVGKKTVALVRAFGGLLISPLLPRREWGPTNVLLRLRECTARSIVVTTAKDEVSRMYCTINCGFHGPKWGFKNVLQDQLWFPWPKMRFQKCTARSIVVSTTKDEVARMYYKINCGFHSQKWGYKNVLQNQLWFPWPMMRFWACATRAIVFSTAKHELSRMYCKINWRILRSQNKFLIKVHKTYFNSTYKLGTD